MARTHIRDEIVTAGRKQLLDLRKVATHPVRQVRKAAPESVVVPGANTRMSARRRILVLGQYPVIALVAISAAYSANIGQWFVLAYAIYVLIRRLDSRYSFGAAIFLLVTIPLFQAIGQSGIAQNAAIYVFELLVVGTIQAIFELRTVGEADD